MHSVNTPISDEHVSKTRKLSSRDFAILANRCRESNFGYPQLSRLFDLRSDFGEYSRAIIDVLSFDVEFKEGRYVYFPLTEYILETFPNVKKENLLKEASFARLLSPGELKRRLDILGIDSSKSFGYINDYVNSSNIPTRIGALNVKTVIARKPKWVIKPDNPKLIKSLRQSKPKDLKPGFNDIVERLGDIAERDDDLVKDNDTKVIKDHVYIDDDIQQAMMKISELEHEDEFNVRIFGPSNGSHRMLICNCFETCGKDGCPRFFWFKDGMCDSCSKKIRRPSYALRFPMEEGGFMGKYCSWDCLRDYPAQEISDIVEFRLQSLKDTLDTFKVYA